MFHNISQSKEFSLSAPVKTDTAQIPQNVFATYATDPVSDRAGEETGVLRRVHFSVLLTRVR